MMDGRRIRLRLVKDHDREVICDQHGRELADVISFAYETSVAADEVSQTLTVRVHAGDVTWDGDLGVARLPKPPRGESD